MKTDIILRINDNLHIVGNRVISYDTEVALIKEDAIYAYGRYSRTTGKQLSRVSTAIGKPLIVPNHKAEFDRYEMGWVPDLRIPDAVSPESSRKILAWMGTGYDILNATAAAWSTIKPIDRERALDKIVDKSAFNELITFYSGLINLGLAKDPVQC